MKILYLTINFPLEKDGNNIYTDLAEELSLDNTVDVIVTNGNDQKTNCSIERKMRVIRVKTGKIFNVNVIEKAISYLILPYNIIKSVNKYLKKGKYDLIIYTAPPVTIISVIKILKRKYKCKTLLMQKDIFPDNAVDINIIKKKSLLYYIFRQKEKKLYAVSDYIGCMSKGNIDYIISHNPKLKDNKLFLLPNAIKIKDIEKGTYNIRKKYNIPKDTVLALYGGNFGKPQGVDFIKKVINNYKKRKDIYFIFAGKGTEKKQFYNYINENNFNNVITLDYLTTAEYSKLLNDVDIGLIFLDSRFTIPNIPSRMLSYLEYSIPIMAATDKNTDLKEILTDNNCGFWSESLSIKNFDIKFSQLIANKNLRKKMGENGRKLLINEYNVKLVAETINNILND